MNKLYQIRSLVGILSPLSISICAALFFDIESNLRNYGFSTVLYLLGLVCFIFVSYISNELYNRCNNYGRIYDIQLNDHVKDQYKYPKPIRKDIFKTAEQRVSSKKRIFQYYGIFVFFILGLALICWSKMLSDRNEYKLNNHENMLQGQIDSLRIINDKQALRISLLERNNDSIIKIKADIQKLNKEKYKSNSIGNRNK